MESPSEVGEVIVETDQFQGSVSDQAESTKPSSSETSSVMVPTEDIESLKRQADLLQEQGDIEEAESAFELAIEKFQRALGLYSKMEDVEGIIQCQKKLGVCHQYLGNYERAQLDLESALTLSKAHNLVSLTGLVLTELAQINHFLGKHVCGKSAQIQVPCLYFKYVHFHDNNASCSATRFLFLTCRHRRHLILNEHMFQEYFGECESTFSFITCNVCETYSFSTTHDPTMFRKIFRISCLAFMCSTYRYV